MKYKEMGFIEDSFEFVSLKRTNKKRDANT